MKPGTLIIIWDYDGAIGRVNSSYPYKFDEQKIYREIENVETILGLADKYDLKMTFACVGIGAEHGVFPYHIQDQIKKIHKFGHEIASHSWRHEWFPYLEKEQIKRSLSRSKYSLELCIGERDKVRGFILPFSRPKSWYSRGAFSLGDRVFGPWYPGASLGSVLKLVRQAEYQWSRVSYRPIWKKYLGGSNSRPNLNAKWLTFRNLVCVPSHIFGFDAAARELMTDLSRGGGSLVVSAHPAALDFGRSESLENFLQFLALAEDYMAKGLIQSKTVAEYIKASEQ